MSCIHTCACLQQAAAIELQKTLHFSHDFGNILKELQLLSRPKHSNKEALINDTLNTLPTKVVSIQNESNANILKIPAIIDKLCSFLEMHLHVVGLFRISGSHKRIALLKERLKNGMELCDENPHDVANMLSQLFRQFKNHLIPKCMNFFIDKIVQMERNEQKLQATQLLCLLLPTIHLHTLIYILHFFHKVVSQVENNKMKSSSLAAIFTPNMCEIGGCNELRKTRSINLKQQEFVQYLIDNCHSVGLIPECLRGSNCPVKKCSHGCGWKLRSTETDSNATPGFAVERKSFADRLMSSLRKKKARTTIPKGDVMKKRGHSETSCGSTEERPAKRRSLQGAADAIHPHLLNATAPSAPIEKRPQSTVNSFRQERYDSGSATCFGGSATKSSIAHNKPFHIGYSSRSKENVSRRNLAKTFTAQDSSKVKRPAFFKRFTGSWMSPVARKRPRSVKRGAKRMEKSEVDTQKEVRKKIVGRNLVNKRVTDVSKLEGIRINDSITIFELSSTSLMEETSTKMSVNPPSPILISSNVTRVYDSFDCLKEGETHPLDPSILRSGTTSPDKIPFSEERSPPPSPICRPSTSMGFRSFDLLHHAESVELLDSSQKQEEYFETMLDENLDFTSRSQTRSDSSLEANATLDSKRNASSSVFSIARDNESDLTSNSIMSSNAVQLTEGVTKRCKNAFESNDAHSVVDASPPTTLAKYDISNASVTASVGSAHDFASANDDIAECKHLMEELLCKVSTHCESTDVFVNQTRNNTLQEIQNKRVKPLPPVRISSLKPFLFRPGPHTVVEELMPCASADEKCEKKDYFQDFHEPRQPKSHYRGFSNFTRKTKNLVPSDENHPFSVSYNSRPPFWQASGKVASTVQHFNNLIDTKHPSVRKLSPLPYRDTRKRRGSFKMGKPTGNQLKLDLPTQLELAPSPDISFLCTPMPEIKAPLIANLEESPCVFRSKHRRSKSLENIARETKDFSSGNMPRSPSVPFIAGRLPLTPLRHQSALHPVWRSENLDFLDSSPAKRATPKHPRSRSPMLPLQTDFTML